MIQVHTTIIDSQHENDLDSGISGLIDDRDIKEANILSIQYEFYTKDGCDEYGNRWKDKDKFTRIIITVREN